MITAAQLRAARALLGIDQRRLADHAGLSVPTIQRMEASDGVVRGNVDSLTQARRRARRRRHRADRRGRGLRRRRPRHPAEGAPSAMPTGYALILIGVAASRSRCWSSSTRRRDAATPIVYRSASSPSLALLLSSPLGRLLLGPGTDRRRHAAARHPLDRRPFPHRRALGLLPRRGQSRRRRREPLRHRLRPP